MWRADGRAEKTIISPWLVSASMLAERGAGCYDAGDVAERLRQILPHKAPRCADASP